MANSTSTPVQTISVVDWTSRVMAAIAIALVCFQLYQPVTPPDSPPVVVTPPLPPSTIKAGHDHGIGLASSWADGLDAAAVLAVPGASSADVIKAIATTSATNRTLDFNVKVKPILDSIVTSGSLDATSAPKLQAALKDLSTGARGVK